MVGQVRIERTGISVSVVVVATVSGPGRLLRIVTARFLGIDLDE